MSPIKGVVRSGRIELEVPADWPEGCEVLIEPTSPKAAQGMREEDWPTTPEGIAELLKSWEEMEPLETTPEEEAGLAAWRQQVKEYTIAHMDSSIEGLFE